MFGRGWDKNECLRDYWRCYVVGLDWVGDEMGVPFCGLAHSRFVGKKGIVGITI
jgi:hypothetical protein